MSKISRIEEGFTQKEVPQFEVGDTVDVHVRIMEGEKERIQVFNGTVIRKRGAGMSATYTVRRIVQGQGVERIFPMHSPFVAKVEVRRAGRVRRSRLYYLRERRGKATRLKEIIRPQGRTQAAPRPPADEVASTSENAAPAAEGQELS